ncbi:hypothetical protein CSOJ01_01789 [Colletotrichum sojae]|uniref:Uncharacterized protein n=1 Tax=Colletotrichum sojae TaxID=2175907 RepID=A0A8H6JSN3_9PEZI|nr:hypothetical protein CSOJ01_01789 [Colletotrichum sojae]
MGRTSNGIPLSYQPADDSVLARHAGHPSPKTEGRSGLVPHAARPGPGPAASGTICLPDWGSTFIPFLPTYTSAPLPVRLHEFAAGRQRPSAPSPGPRASGWRLSNPNSGTAAARDRQTDSDSNSDSNSGSGSGSGSGTLPGNHEFGIAQNDFDSSESRERETLKTWREAAVAMPLRLAALLHRIFAHSYGGQKHTHVVQDINRQSMRTDRETDLLSEQSL